MKFATMLLLPAPVLLAPALLTATAQEKSAPPERLAPFFRPPPQFATDSRQ